MKPAPHVLMFFAGMRTCCSLLLVLCCLPAANAQFSELHLDAGRNERADRVLVVGDHLIVAGLTDENVVDRTEAIFHRLDRSGSVVQTTRLASNRRSSFRAATLTEDGGFILGAWNNTQTTIDQLAFNRFDAEANEVGSWTLGDEELDEEVRDLISVGNDRYLAVGNVGSRDDAFAALIDGVGEVIWWQNFRVPANNFNIFTDAVLDGDELVLIGHGIDDNTTPMLFARFSLGGELLAHRQYLSSGERANVDRSLLLLPNGNLVVTTTYRTEADEGNILVLTLDPAGEILNQFSFGGPGRDRIAASALAADGSLIFAGHSRTPSEEFTRSFLLNVTPAGEILQQRYLSSSNRSRITDLIPSEDGGYYLSGFLECEERLNMMLLYLTADLERPDGCNLGSPDLELLASLPITSNSPGVAEAESIPTLAGAPLADVQAATSIDFSCISLTFDEDGNRTIGTGADTHIAWPPTCGREPIPLTDVDLELRGVPDSMVFRVPVGFEFVLAGSPLVANTVAEEMTVRTVFYPTSAAEAESILRDLAIRPAGPNPPLGERVVISRFNFPCGRQLTGLTEFNYLDTELDVDLPDTTLCPGASVTLDATTPGATEYLWEGTAGPILEVDQPGSFTVRIGNECRTVFDTVNVMLGAPNLVTPELTDFTLCLGDSVSIDATVPGADQYLWSDDAVGPERSINAMGTYRLAVNNACERVSIQFNVTSIDCCRFYLPTAFSPNGDGVNDTYRAEPAVATCEEVRNFEMSVYNRWGGQLYRSEDQLAGWDGRFRGEPVRGTVLVVIRYHSGIDWVELQEAVSILR
ncbi:gliding motility-associated C-terminal domain-containing protein [Lewinella sp. 4G2]|uniref:T9SS type B sorting domain-containing protein n=1 Tax=Lewinella sp. 4G2 TaxID=1803372 RepID=UPI0007B4A6D2|nr:gliding motility-associated C-terminal domain-containing protein [Lewinella sp. 4G2]OAV44098.1 hypothetical protein A3850_006110 [Lewinella sp. 4G2]